MSKILAAKSAMPLRIISAARKFCEKFLDPRRGLWRGVAEIKVESGGLAMIMKAVIALILFGLTSSANAMTVIFKDYKSAANKDEKVFYLLYLDGVREGIIELNVLLAKIHQPLFCLPEKLTLTVGRSEDIMMRQAQKVADPDQLPIGRLLAEGLKDAFPCDKKH